MLQRLWLERLTFVSEDFEADSDFERDPESDLDDDECGVDFGLELFGLPSSPLLFCLSPAWLLVGMIIPSNAPDIGRRI